jgi:hypothetical protein
VIKAQRLVYRSTLGVREIKKKKRRTHHVAALIPYTQVPNPERTDLLAPDVRRLSGGVCGSLRTV